MVGPFFGLLKCHDVVVLPSCKGQSMASKVDVPDVFGYLNSAKRALSTIVDSYLTKI